MNISDLSAIINGNTTAALKFYVDGSVINPGYHVTEVRHAAIKSRDCGRHSSVERWDEITIQLLDGSSDSTQDHMSGAKFLGIVGTALDSIATDAAPYLYFEYSPDNGPIRKLSIESVNSADGEIAVSLGSERAVCKPFERLKSVAVIGEAAPAKSCCSGGASSNSGSCC